MIDRSDKNIFQLLRDDGIQIRVHVGNSDTYLTPEEAPPPTQPMTFWDMLWISKAKTAKETQKLADGLEKDPVSTIAQLIAESSDDNCELLSLILGMTKVTKDSEYKGSPLWQWAIKWLRMGALSALIQKPIQVELGSVAVVVKHGIIFKRPEVVQMQYPATVYL